MKNLFEHSKEIILANQSLTGAYVASPNFPTYQYSWFRDGSFIAYSMDLVGEYQSSKKFHAWAAKMINRRKDVIKRAVNKSKSGEKLEKTDFLHTRYSINGSVSEEDWPNFQLDGFGTWLWALEKHQNLSGFQLSPEILQAAELLAYYLSALWRLPCYDCWEEFPENVHSHTLAAIYAGLKANMELNKTDYGLVVDSIKKYILNNAVSNGHFVKYIGDSEVDASLLGLSTPYAVVDPSNSIMDATSNKIHLDLQKGHGVHRYLADTYYGGGEWILLSAWQGWHNTQVGKVDEAKESLRWIEQQANSQNELPEQISATLNDETFLLPWQRKWGEIAAPLLWSHAMYIILYSELEKLKT